MIASIEKLNYRIFIFLLIFCPLALGTVYTWTLAVMEALSLTAVLLLFISRGLQKKAIYWAPGTLLLMLFPAYILFQLIPLPAELVRIISPSTYSLYQETIGIFDPIKWVSLSINKKTTLEELMRYLSYAGFYLLTVHVLAHGSTLKKTVKYLAIFATILSVTAILQRFTSPNNILWFYKSSSGFGPYVNNNHYAGLMEMVFPVVFSLFLFYKPRVSYPSLREKIVELFSQIRTSDHILLGFSSLLIALSVFLSLSRGGIIFLSISAGFCFLMIGLKRGTVRSSSNTVFLLLFLLVISVSWFGWKPIFEEFGKTTNERGEIAENRPVYWQSALSAFKDFPVTGTGMGTLKEIYPKYQSKATGSRLTHAHNDYIEFLVNGGVVGFFLFFGFLATVVYKTFKAFRKRREPYAIFIYIGSISGIVAILLHSMTDFNLQIGANGLYLFFLCGLAVSASHTRFRQGLGNTRLQPLSARAKKRLVSTAACMLVLVPLVAWFNISTIKNESLLDYALELWDIENPSEIEMEKLAKIGQRAVKYDPLDFFSPWLAAKTANQMGDDNKALFYFKKAIHRNPVYGPLLQDFGEFMSETGRLDLAERLILAGIKYNRINSNRYKTYAEWLLANKNKARGIETMRTAILLNVGKSRYYIEFMDKNGLDLNEIRSALPNRVEPIIDLAEYLLDKGMQQQAENTYLEAFNYLDKEAEVSPNYFFRASTYFTKQKNYDEALNIMLKGIEYLPDNPKIRIAAAFLYEKLGIPYRATEELKYALILDPKDRQAQKKLQELIARQ